MRASWRVTDPRFAVVVAAVVLEGLALVLWPTMFLADSSLEPSPLAEMMRRRLEWVSFVVQGLETSVDWVFPGALWSWEALVTFFVHSLLIGFVAYGALSWRLARAAERGEGEVPTLGKAWIFLPLAIFQLTLVFTPATLTTDIYNYAIYGEMPVLYGSNPFTHTPAEFPQSVLYYLIPVYWHGAPSAYGPAWVLISMAVASGLQSHPLIDELLAYRFIANVSHLANAALIWAIAERMRPRSGPAAAVAYGWNPAALLEFAMNGHNDVLMLTPMLGSVLLTMSGRTRVAALALGISVAMKYTSILAAPLLLIWGAWMSGTKQATPFVLDVLAKRGLLVALVVDGAIVVGILVVLYVPFLSDGWDTFRQVAYWVTGPRIQNYWPESMLLAVTAWISGPLQLEWNNVWEPVLSGYKNVARVLLVGAVLWEVWRARRAEDVLAGGTRVWLLFLLLVNTWIMPWYYLWPLALAAPLGWSSMLVRVAAGMTLTATLTMYGKQLNFSPVGEWAGLTLVLPLVMAGVWGLRGYARSGQPARTGLL